MCCYKLELQKKNEEKLKRKLDEVGIPVFMRKYFLVKIESKAGALHNLIVLKDLFQWLVDERLINKSKISDIVPSDFNNIMAEDITMYLNQKEMNGMSPTTLETRKHVISGFWSYLSRIKGCDVSKDFSEDITYKGIPSGRNIYKIPSESQLDAMEEKILWKKDTAVRNRNIAIFRILKGTGLRESELAGLNLSDLHLDEEIPYVTILGKGVFREAQSRKVFLSGSAYHSLEEWLSYRETRTDILDKEAVLINKTGIRTTEDNIKKMFQKYGGGITPHMIRHFYATRLSKDSDIFAQQQLGHSSIRTTKENYVDGSVGMKEVLNNM